MLQVCLNGTRGPGDSAAVPMSPESLAESAARAVAAGAGEVRVYPRTPCEGTSLSPRVLGPVLSSVRAAVARTAAGRTAAGRGVGVAVAAAAEPDVGRRMERIRSWALLPDLVSVDWHESGAEEVAGALLERGIGVEAGLWARTDGPERFARSALAPRVRRVLVKVPYPPAGSGAEDASRSFLSGLELPPGVPVLLHGEDGSAWPVLRLALRLGLVARIGLEDTVLLPDGTRAGSNAELVTAALAG
ncbi:3-keto-5-aminohexanoate cleavage protein [Streptomyces sp. TX20-6-3]|uniref:3-keto-5-aminohexanoate cleavage protein n=1 Tax=Streptomyces sp. TX20-6-3 TaxID=3028705 RepID=UPI0029A6DE89|nr:3-keto-5-aminohexanoate cleavage protein [Streptomyces sp. TX20-6-3]MDX2563570.1 3-keto-5-aminohexanoate cleavage protein [Streptomyces sp. TX20-6-3]